jgi:glycine cleavage system H protein
MSSNIPEHLLYTEEHEWIDPDTGWMGISDFAQDELGDIVYVDLPDVGQSVEAMQSFMIVESVKAVSDVYAPVSGSVSDINETVQNQPELVNDSPYEDGRLVKFDVDDDLDDLMDAEAYADHVG